MRHLRVLKTVKQIRPKWLLLFGKCPAHQTFSKPSVAFIPRLSVFINTVIS